MPHSYPGAHNVAPIVHKHFAACVESASTVPDVETIEAIIDVAFWASLRREEGRSPKISLAFLSYDQAQIAMTFARPLPLEAAQLARVAPAVERAGIHLGVDRKDRVLQVWGTTRRIPPGTFILEVFEPGVLVVKRRRSEAAGKFANIAVLEGDRIKLIDDTGDTETEKRPLIAQLLGLDSARSWSDPANVTVQLATSMRAHGRGGSLLIVPTDSTTWMRSLVQPIRYEVSPRYSGLSVLMQQKPDAESELLWRERLRRSVDALAGLTGVDGATVINDRYEVLAFGAKIRAEHGRDQVDRIAVWEPVIGVPTTVVNAAEIGGTRHLSAAQFVHDRQDALALVASQDGRFTAFAWSPAESLVRAYRVEALLL